MADQYNITNLELDDNSFEVIPDGDYHFRVTSYEIGYATSDKMPPNTQQIICNLEIPFMKDGVVAYAKVRNNLNLYSKAMFAIRQFAECIGLVPEKGRQKVDLTQMVGKSGVCAITIGESKRGNEFNNVETFYAPSKAPAATANDDAWKRDGFEPIKGEDILNELSFN